MVTAVWCVIGVRAKCQSGDRWKSIWKILLLFRWVRTNIQCIRRQPSFTIDSTYSHQHHRIISHIHSSEISSSFCSRIEQSSFDSCIIRSLHSRVCSSSRTVNLIPRFFFQSLFLRCSNQSSCTHIWLHHQCRGYLHRLRIISFQTVFQWSPR